MTSNIGSDIIRESFEMINEYNHDEILAKTRNKVYDLLKKTIRPEFLNRVDEIIMFTPLMEDEIEQIVRLQIQQLQKMLSKNHIQIEVTDEAIKRIEQADPVFWQEEGVQLARPLVTGLRPNT